MKKKKLLAYIMMLVVLILVTSFASGALSVKETVVDNRYINVDGRYDDSESFNIELEHKSKVYIIFHDNSSGNYKVTVENNAGELIATEYGNTDFVEIRHIFTLEPASYLIKIYCTDTNTYFDGNVSIKTVHEEEDPKPVYSLKKSSVTLGKGDSYTVKLLRSPKGEMDKAKWSTSDKKVATVSKNGKIKAVGKGKATITVKINDQKLKFKVKVNNLKLNKSEVILYICESTTLSVNSTSKVTWSTSNKKVVTVSSKGKIKTVRNGTAVVTAKVNGTKLKCKVIVKDCSISKSSISIKRGATKKLSLVGADKSKVTWSSSNNSVATVSSNGTVTGVNKGTATITARYNKKNYTCTVTVKHRAPVKIKYVDWYINSADGVEPSIEFKNQSGKQIKYITFETYYYDSLGDPAYCYVRENYGRTLYVSETIKNGVTDTYYWNAVLYNSSVSAIDFKTITIEYSDGTSEEYEYNTLWYDKNYYYNW